MRMFITFSEQVRRCCIMWIKIVCFLLLLQINTNFAAPAPNPLQRTRIQRDSANGSGNACCIRRSKLEVLKSRGTYHILCIVKVFVNRWRCSRLLLISKIENRSYFIGLLVLLLFTITINSYLSVDVLIPRCLLNHYWLLLHRQPLYMHKALVMTDNNNFNCVVFTDINNFEVTIDVGECVQCKSDPTVTNLSLPAATVSQLLYYMHLSSWNIYWLTDECVACR